MTVIWRYIPWYTVYLQDQYTILIVPPYPYNVEDHPDVPLEDLWYTRPQLFFTCALCLRSGRSIWSLPTKPAQMIQCTALFFFSTFEVLDLPIKGPMEDAGVTKLHELSHTPCLYVAPAANTVSRVPLTLLFLAGNRDSTPTIPHMFSKRKDSGFLYGRADTAAADGRRGSNVYEAVEFCSWQAPPGWSECWEDIWEAGCSGRSKQGACSWEHWQSTLQGRQSLIQSKGGVWQFMSWVYKLLHTWYIQLHPWPIPVYTHFSQVTIWKVIYQIQIQTPGYHAICMHLEFRPPGRNTVYRSIYCDVPSCTILGVHVRHYGTTRT